MTDRDGGYSENDEPIIPLGSSPSSRDYPSPFASWSRKPLEESEIHSKGPLLLNLSQDNQDNNEYEEDEDQELVFLEGNNNRNSMGAIKSETPPISPSLVNSNSSINQQNSLHSSSSSSFRLKSSRSNSDGILARKRNVLEDEKVAKEVVSINHEYDEGEEPNKLRPSKRDSNFYSIVYDKTDEGEDFNSSNEAENEIIKKTPMRDSFDRFKIDETKSHAENDRIVEAQQKQRANQNNENIVVPDVDTRGLAEDEVKLYHLANNAQNQVNQLITQVKQLISDKSLLLTSIKREKRANSSQFNSPVHSSAASPLPSPRLNNSNNNNKFVNTSPRNSHDPEGFASPTSVDHSQLSMSNPGFWTDERISSEREALSLVMKNIVDVSATLSSLHNSTKQRMLTIQTAQFGSVRNWNGQFQEILDLPQKESLERVYRFERISQLANDFEHTAITYGKIIISEASLPIHQKTVKPVSIGGQAGGEKYIHAGILFKFALDWKGIYGGDEYCMKAASNELKGLSRYFSCGVGLCVPLMTLIDYMGYRLIAMSILPISRDTLVYGSMDFGRTLASPTKECDEMMDKAAEKLNLKRHMAGIKGDCPISAPVDIEVHLGKDKRYYLIDAARTFCPTTPEKGVRACYLYKLFRPEFVKTNPSPLSSDAFAPVDKFDPQKVQHRQDVIEATNRLLVTVIPEFAKHLDSTFDRSQTNVFTKMKTLQKTFVHDLHRAGINIRYIGIVRSHTKNPFVRRFLLMEMIARSIKNLLRAELRRISRTNESQAIEPYKKVVLDLFNLIINGRSSSLNPLQNRRESCFAPHETTRYVFGDSDDAMDFWKDQLEPSLRRHFLLFPSEQQLEDELEAEKSDINIMLHKCIVSGICTYNITSQNYIEQPFYNCFTCGLLEDLGCCSVCAEICHKGHNISATQKLSKFFCDCQLQGHCKIEDREPKEFFTHRGNNKEDKVDSVEELLNHRMKNLLSEKESTKEEDLSYTAEYGGEYGEEEEENGETSSSSFERENFFGSEEEMKPNTQRRSHLKRAEIIRKNNNNNNSESNKSLKESKKNEKEEDEEVEPEHILKYIVRSSLGFAKLFKRVAKISGIEISSYCKRSLKKHGENFIFVDVDIKDFIVRSRPMDFIAAAEANAFALRASLESGTVMASSGDSIPSSSKWSAHLYKRSPSASSIKTHGKKVSRMFTLSQSKFEQALNASPDSRETIETYAGFLLEMAFRSSNSAIDWSLLSLAMVKYKDIERLDIIIETMERAKKLKPWDIEYLSFQKETWKMILDSPLLCKKGSIVKTVDLTELSVTPENCVTVVKCFENLTHLYMPDSGAKVSSVQYILDRCRGLVSLDVAGISSSESGTEELSFANQAELMHLNVSRCGVVLTHLGKSTPKLRSVVAALTSAIAHKQTLHSICKNCPDLTKLMLNGYVPLTDRGVRPIVRHAKDLRILGLSSISLSRDAFIQLANSLTKLEEINIERSDNLDDDCLKMFLKNCKNIRAINVPFCNKISKSVLDELEKLKTLDSLRISGNDNMNNNTIFSITKMFPMITILDISKCAALTTAVTASIAKHLTRLEHLNLGYCPKMNDVAVQNLKTLTHLLTLNLSGTLITDGSMECVLENFPDLVALLINNCQNISYPPVKRLITEKSSLQLFMCQKCPLISLEGLKDVRPQLFSNTCSRIIYEDIWAMQSYDYYLVDMGNAGEE
eukprot:TRINITY_DN3939_c0_g1_i1.p1 TRINITY_DN3939_c0_g1~~TRINITY_DN3939_c0_g1_i1.p1  ORF type:complete len:1699 (-),score=618.56 TRINITY_DN3939_c0_g1_i1:206-5302(-)